MIRRIAEAARRGVSVRLFVPANANNWACGAAQQYHHATLLDAGVRMLEYPTMLHAKAFVRDGEDVLLGTCNFEAWSLKRFFEIDIQLCVDGRRPRSSRSASACRPRPCPDLSAARRTTERLKAMGARRRHRSSTPAARENRRTTQGAGGDARKEDPRRPL